MSEIWIDGRVYEVDSKRNLLDVCLSLGLDLPYFCWHPALGSVGSCRQCAVKHYRNENDAKGSLVMACMTPATPGTRISIDDPDARELRRSVIEFLMVNHPHDCPVCDEGGECHLQDMTVKTGHNYRNYRYQKKTYLNQDLGPLVNHEMNRCIQCYRCVRFYNDYAGGHDLQVFGAHDHVYFGRHEDGVLESEFSGNLVEICPTGVFTDKRLKRHFTRKWDLQTAPSVCVHCSLGCNITPGERYGALRRVRARYNGAVNGYFICDRGRYGYEFVNHERRLRAPLLPRGPDQPAEAITAQDARDHLSALLTGSAQEHAGRVIGIGSPRASLESNFALQTLVGSDNFYRGIDAREARITDAIRDILEAGGARTPSLREVEHCDAVLVLGEDLANSAPMLALALHQAVRQAPHVAVEASGIPLWNDAAVRERMQGERGPLFVATPAQCRLDEIAERTVRGAPEDLARLGFAIAHELDAEAPEVADLSEPLRELARTVASALAAAERPLVVSGIACDSESVVRAAANVAWALSRLRGRLGRQPAELLYALPECNSLGLALLGGAALEQALERVLSNEIDVVIVLENDLYRRVGAATAERLLAAGHVVVLDHVAHATAAHAELVLPVATFAESSGTLVSNEGRAQRFYQTFVPEGEIPAAWRWLASARSPRGGESPWVDLDSVVRAIARSTPRLRELDSVGPPASERWAGSKIPRELHRYSGRTSMHARVELREPKPPDDLDAPLTFSMEGFAGRPPAQLACEFWSPGWNSIQALNRFQEEVAGPLRGGDPGLRLFEPAGSPSVLRPDYDSRIPNAFARRAEELRLVSLDHVFGSEELSALSPGIAELTPEPYLALSAADHEGLNGAALVSIHLGERLLQLPVRVVDLPPGVAGLPRGLPSLATGPLPEWVRIEGIG